MKSKRIYSQENSLNEPSASLTLITSLDAEPLLFDYRIDNNDQWNFLEVVLYACSSEFLKRGDYLIVDNAAVHHGEDSSDLLDHILNAFGKFESFWIIAYYIGVELVFLPAYSPELNPCELIFAQIKKELRNKKALFNEGLFDKVISAACHVTLQNVVNYYSHCIFPNKGHLQELKQLKMNYLP